MDKLIRYVLNRDAEMLPVNYEKKRKLLREILKKHKELPKRDNYYVDYEK